MWSESPVGPLLVLPCGHRDRGHQGRCHLSAVGALRCFEDAEQQRGRHMPHGMPRRPTLGDAPGNCNLCAPGRNTGMHPAGEGHGRCRPRVTARRPRRVTGSYPHHRTERPRRRCLGPCQDDNLHTPGGRRRSCARRRGGSRSTSASSLPEPRNTNRKLPPPDGRVIGRLKEAEEARTGILGAELAYGCPTLKR